MNKKVITVIILATIALVILYLYSFGPLANRRHIAQVNPESLKPTSSQDISEYNNRDLKENYYHITFPQTWLVEQGTATGGYLFSFDVLKGSVELVDVPDNTTLELFVLSQEEPKLRKEVPGYEKTSYLKLSLSGTDAYELKYASTLNGDKFENIKTYISGQDMAGGITITIPQGKSSSFAQEINSVLTSFQWEN